MGSCYSSDTTRKLDNTQETILRFICSSDFPPPPTVDDFIFNNPKNLKNIKFNKIVKFDESILRPGSPPDTLVDWSVLVAAITTYPLPWMDHDHQNDEDEDGNQNENKETNNNNEPLPTQQQQEVQARTFVEETPFSPMSPKTTPSLASLVTRILSQKETGQIVDVLLRGAFVSSREPFSDVLHLLVRSFPDKTDVLKICLDSIKPRDRTELVNHTVWDKLIAEADAEKELMMESPTAQIENFSRATSPTKFDLEKSKATSNALKLNENETTLLRLAIKTSIQSHHFENGLNVAKLLLQYNLPVSEHLDLNGESVFHDLASSRIFLKPTSAVDEENFVSPGTKLSVFPTKKGIMAKSMKFVVDCFREIVVFSAAAGASSSSSSPPASSSSSSKLLKWQQADFRYELSQVRSKLGFNVLHTAALYSFNDMVDEILAFYTSLPTITSSSSTRDEKASIATIQSTSQYDGQNNDYDEANNGDAATSSAIVRLPVTRNENSTFYNMNALHLACSRRIEEEYNDTQENETIAFAKALHPHTTPEDVICKIVKSLLRMPGSKRAMNEICGLALNRDNCLSLALRNGNRKLCRLLMREEELMREVPEEGSLGAMRILNEEEKEFIGNLSEPDDDDEGKQIFGDDDDSEEEHDQDSDHELELVDVRAHSHHHFHHNTMSNSKTGQVEEAIDDTDL